MLRDGTASAAEFQKFNRSSGRRSEFSLGRIGAPATRPRVCQARRHRQSQAAYQDFLTLWKDADPDIPILIAAKAEYAKLQ
jgi:hypothetical protein